MLQRRPLSFAHPASAALGMRRCWLALATRLLLWGVILVLSPAMACAQAATSGPAKPAQPAKPASGEFPAFLDDAKAYVIEVGDPAQPVELQEKPILNWTNPVRQRERGATYVWLHQGRPLVLASLFTYEHEQKTYSKHEFLSLSTAPLTATFHDQLTWSPTEPGIKWELASESLQPAKTHTARLLQMRQLARPFSAQITDLEGVVTELRLAPRPLYEYSSPENGILDGAIFSFTVATDPEVLLLVEAIDESQPGGPGFRYAFARCHYWTLRALRDGQTVWEAALDRSHETGQIGDTENLAKPYTSYHPRPALPSSSVQTEVPADAR